MMTEAAGRKSPPAQLAKIATAGASGVFVFGVAAVMGWSQRSVGEPDLVPGQSPATTTPSTPTTAAAPQATTQVSTTTSLVPLATTIPAAPAPAAVPPPQPVVAPAPAPPQAPVIVSEQSE